MQFLPKNPSEDFKRRNPHLYPVREVETRQCEQSQVCSLDKGIQKRQKGKGSVEIVVTLISCRRKELDDDGNISALKPLRDSVSSSIGLDDGDKRIRFEYGQCETRGDEGVIVKVERLNQIEII